MGCLFSIGKGNSLMGSSMNTSLSSDDSLLENLDIQDFAGENTKQVCVLDHHGAPSQKVSVENFTFLKVILLT